MTTRDLQQNKDQIQGIVLTGYKPFACASYFLLKIDDIAKTKGWFKTLLEQCRVTHAADIDTKAPQNRLNLAISNSGMQKLLGEDKDLEKLGFERAFYEGMYSQHRSTLLGDHGSNAIDQWQWGTKDSVDLLVMLYSKDETIHTDSKAKLQDEFNTVGLREVKRLDASQKLDANGFLTEHFGYADGLSEPVVRGFDKSRSAPAGELIETGEFLLGYPHQYEGKFNQIPVDEDFGANGTYLVLRQLKQDVGAFWAYMEQEAEAQGLNKGDSKFDEFVDYLAAKFVGRWKSGALVEPHQSSDPSPKEAKDVDNSFDFSKDKHGYGCPLGSHIRRTNPRGVGLSATEDESDESLKVANRHRILRRGRSYGHFLDNLKQDDGQERGLVFICLNANIERQFEFIQHTWINNIKFAGLYNENDPMIGSSGSDNRNFTIQDQQLRRRVCGFQQFVTTRGGGYFFLPSLKALGRLGSS
jgi:Dyp-type peroxidase family